MAGVWLPRESVLPLHLGLLQGTKEDPSAKDNVQLNKVKVFYIKTLKQSIVYLCKVLICVQVKEFLQIEHTHVTGARFKK